MSTKHSTESRDETVSSVTKGRTVVELIAAARQRKPTWTLARWAKACGYSGPGFSALARGHIQHVQLRKLVRMARGLKCSVDDLANAPESAARDIERKTKKSDVR